MSWNNCLFILWIKKQSKNLQTVSKQKKGQQKKTVFDSSLIQTILSVMELHHVSKKICSWTLYHRSGISPCPEEFIIIYHYFKTLWIKSQYKIIFLSKNLFNKSRFALHILPQDLHNTKSFVYSFVFLLFQQNLHVVQKVLYKLRYHIAVQFLAPFL